MTEPFTILFLSSGDCSLSQIAKGLFAAKNDTKTLVYAAGIESKNIAPEARELINESGFSLTPDDGQRLADLERIVFDLVITLDSQARKYSSSSSGDQIEEFAGLGVLLIGMPVFLHWPTGTKTPADREQKSPDYFRKSAECLQRRIEVLLNDGYLASLITQRKNNRQLINSLGDGLIMHDNSRRLCIFNDAAERITGFKREEVLGRDCHEVFGPDGFCGGQCAFKEKPSRLTVDREYQINIVTASGEQKLVRMSVTPTVAHDGWPGGIIASIRDITEINELRWQLKEKYNFQGMVGASPAMQEVFQTIRQVVTSDYPVLITGASGTGKELVANAIHNESRRSGGPFVPINCGALPEGILESELFGHVRGAFTGAIRDKKGRFEMADGGTLFLDEVGELTPAFQVKLLRVLQENRFERVGGEKSIQVDVRIISATNRSLAELIKEGGFREDLFYRLSVVPIKLPPLRQRREDIPALVTHILPDVRRETGKKDLFVSPKAMSQLLSYVWPGNVRELINTLRYAAVRCAGGSILLKDLPPEIRQARVDGRLPLPTVMEETIPSPKREYSRGKLDTDEVRNALSTARGNKVRAAKILGVGRATLYRFLNSHPDYE